MVAIASFPDDSVETDSQKGKYLTFPLGDIFYGIEITHVLEVVIRTPKIKITQIPHMPSYAKGAINLRGELVPILDLHIRFELPEIQYTERTCFVVVNIEGIIAGLVVDTVSGVILIPDKDIDEPPHLESSSEQQFITGIGKAKDTVYILIDVRKLFRKKELNQLKTNA